MDEAKTKFTLGWKTVFPGTPIPDLSFFASSELVENEITERLHKVQHLKFQLAQEEFLLEKLKEIKDIYSLIDDDKFEDDSIANKKEINDNIVQDENSVNGGNDKEKAEYKAIWDTVPKPKLVSEPEPDSANPDLDKFKPIWECVPKPLNKAPSFGDAEELLPTPDKLHNTNSPVSSMDFNVEKGPTFNVEVLKNNTDIIAIHRHVDNNPEQLKVYPGNSFSTFQSNKIHSGDVKSLSQSSLNEMFLSESTHPDDDSVKMEPLENFADIKTHRKSYSIDENVFDYSSPIPVARRLTDPLPNSKEEKVKPKPAPRTMSRKKKPLPPLPKKTSGNPVVTDINLTSQLTAKNKALSEPPSFPPPPTLQDRSISETSSAYQDDEHIYTDISELNINRQKMGTPEVEESFSGDDSPTEQIYENSNMQPKLEPLVDNSSKPYSLELENPKVQQRKRLGSHDRQGMALPDDMDVNGPITGSAATGSTASLEEILNGSQESLVDDIWEYPNKPSIIVNNQYDDSSDDEEHIYANVNDLNLYSKGSDDDSDHDGLGDSISHGLPSPHYTELTPAQIQSMLQKIQNNTSDHSQGMHTFCIRILGLDFTKKQFYKNNLRVNHITI